MGKSIAKYSWGYVTLQEPLTLLGSNDTSLPARIHPICDNIFLIIGQCTCFNSGIEPMCLKIALHYLFEFA